MNDRFVRFTRLDGRPIWLNANYIVTVEPGEKSGATVVPIGDGLDYDVKESPEQVLEAMGCTVASAQAPAPAPAEPPQEPAPAQKKTSRGKAKSKVSAEYAAPEEPAAPAASAADDIFAAAMAEVPPPPEAPAKRKSRAKTRKPVSALGEEELSRLRKLAPKTIAKLRNTLVTQFKSESPDDEVKVLESAGVISIDQNRVTWKL